MAERKYSMTEIDWMRHALERSYPTGVSYYPAERSKEIEERLRTYMLNGTDPEELHRWSQEQQEQDRRNHDMHQRFNEEWNARIAASQAE